MSQSCIPEDFSVVIENRRPKNNFIASVSVHIRRMHPVHPLAAYRRRFIIAAPAPELLEFAIDHVIGIHLHPRVGAPQDQQTGANTVQTGDAKQMTRSAIVFLIAPVLHPPACRPIRPVQLPACQPVQK